MIFGKQLSRGRKSRKALFRALTRSVILNGEVETTFTKAKAVQPELEKLVGLVKKGDVAAKRMVDAMLGNDRETSTALFTRYSALAKTGQSGFTTITRLPARRGDAAEMARVGFVNREGDKSDKPQVTSK